MPPTIRLGTDTRAHTHASHHIRGHRHPARDWWEIEVTSGLPDQVVGVSQAHLTEVEEVARDLVAELLGVEASAVDFRLLVVPHNDARVDPAPMP